MIAVLWVAFIALIVVAGLAFMRGYRVVLVVALGAILYLMTPIGSAAALAIGLVVVIGAVFVWGLLGGLPGTPAFQRAQSRRRMPGTPLQTTLFRTVLVALVALLAVVGGWTWWGERQQQNESLYSRDQALAALDLAYTSQPWRDGGSSAEVPPGVPVYPGHGLWMSAEAYLQLRDVIKESDGGMQTFLLSGREEQPAKLILPPSVYSVWKDQPSSDIAIPSYSFPTQVLRLPRGATASERRAAERRWLAYIKEHGWRIGWARPDQGRQRYAMWRTGANTASYVLIHPAEPDPWYYGFVQWGFQALFLYAFLVPFAAVAAWYLRRRIVRPVANVARASASLASGERPDPIPEEGPSELRVMSSSFNTMAKRLEKARAAQASFLASVGHELKTPLTAIDGYAELLTDGAVDPRQAGEVLAHESARLRRLVGDLLDLARIDRSEFSVLDEDVDLAVTAREVSDRYSSLAADRKVALQVDAPAPTLVRGDPGRLLQIASNLVENAVRVTPEGGQVGIVVRPGLLEVTDTGPGLSAEDLDHAFERFYLHRKYGDAEVGTGLGLAIVRELAEAMGGEADAASEPGAGSIFRVRLREAFPADSATY